MSAGGHLKRTHLELGGKAPVVVFGDADVAATRRALACTSCTNGRIPAEVEVGFIGDMGVRIQRNVRDGVLLIDEIRPRREMRLHHVQRPI